MASLASTSLPLRSPRTSKLISRIRDAALSTTTSSQQLAQNCEELEDILCNKYPDTELNDLFTDSVLATINNSRKQSIDQTQQKLDSLSRGPWSLTEDKLRQSFPSPNQPITQSRRFLAELLKFSKLGVPFSQALQSINAERCDRRENRPARKDPEKWYCTDVTQAMVNLNTAQEVNVIIKAGTANLKRKRDVNTGTQGQQEEHDQDLGDTRRKRRPRETTPAPHKTRRRRAGYQASKQDEERPGGEEEGPGSGVEVEHDGREDEAEEQLDGEAEEEEELNSGNTGTAGNEEQLDSPEIEVGRGYKRPAQDNTFDSSEDARSILGDSINDSRANDRGLSNNDSMNPGLNLGLNDDDSMNPPLEDSSDFPPHNQACPPYTPRDRNANTQSRGADKQVNTPELSEPAHIELPTIQELQSLHKEYISKVKDRNGVLDSAKEENNTSHAALRQAQEKKQPQAKALQHKLGVLKTRMTAIQDRLKIVKAWKPIPQDPDDPDEVNQNDPASAATISLSVQLQRDVDAAKVKIHDCTEALSTVQAELVALDTRLKTCVDKDLQMKSVSQHWLRYLDRLEAMLVNDVAPQS